MKSMVSHSYEGVFVALLPQRGSELLELLREVSKQFLGDRDPRSWALELGPLQTPAGAIAFRLVSSQEDFPWRDGAAAEFCRRVSLLGPGRCWVLAIEKGRGEFEGWCEGMVYDRGERKDYEESNNGSTDLLAWFGEQLALSENEVMALFESCDQTMSLTGGAGQFEDEIDSILDRAKREFQKYRELKQARERARMRSS
jgi:hypothetical protein